MVHPHAPGSIRDFLGSASFFASAVQELLNEQLEGIEASDLTLGQVKLLELAALADTDVLILRDAAEFLGVSPPAASKAVEKLVRRGLLARLPDTEDRRAIHLELTRDGRVLLDRFADVTSEVFARVFGDVPATELARARTLLDEVSLRVIDNQVTERRVCFQCGIFLRQDCVLRRAHGRRCHYHVQQEARAGRR